MLAEGDRQIEVDLSVRDLRQRFAAPSPNGAQRRRAASRCTRAIPVLPVPTDRDVADQLRELIGQRMARRPLAWHAH